MLSHLAEQPIQLSPDRGQNLGNRSLLDHIVVLQLAFSLGLLMGKTAALGALSGRALADFVLFDVALHDFSVEGQRTFVYQMVGQLALFWLHDIDLAHAYDVGETIILFVHQVLGLLSQEALMTKCCVYLLAKASCWTFVFRGLLVELSHLCIKLVDLVFRDDSCCSFAETALLGIWRSWRGSSILFSELFYLILNICYPFLKNLILEELVAELDAKA